MVTPDWVMPALVVVGMATQVMLAIDKWVHSRSTDATSISSTLKRVSTDVESLRSDVLTLRERTGRIQFRLEEAEKLRVERASYLAADLGRLGAAVSDNHRKASEWREDCGRQTAAMLQIAHKTDKRILEIEAWIDRPVRLKSDDEGQT